MCDRMLIPKNRSRIDHGSKRSPMFIRALAFLFSLTQFVLAQQPTPIVSDPKLTPGGTFDVSVQDICVPGYTKKARNVPAEMKREVYEEYGVTSHGPGDYATLHREVRNSRQDFWNLVRQSVTS